MWKDLVSSCQDCDRSGVVWRHSSCGGAQQINEEGEVRCKKCYQQNSIGRVQFNCSSHTLDHGRSGYKSLPAALSIAFELSKGDKAWAYTFQKKVQTIMNYS